MLQTKRDCKLQNLVRRIYELYHHNEVELEAETEGDAQPVSQPAYSHVCAHTHTLNTTFHRAHPPHIIQSDIIFI